jgi:hypothetical protein
LIVPHDGGEWIYQNAAHVGRSTGGSEVARYIGRHSGAPAHAEDGRELGRLPRDAFDQKYAA